MFNKPTNSQFAAIFDQIAADYDKSLNRYATTRRVEFIRRYAKGKCLEVGAGTGTISQALSKNHPVVATDIAPRMVQFIKKTKKISAFVSDAEKLPFKRAAFGSVISSEMIYYLDHPEKFFQEANRVLKSDGRLLLTSSAKITETYDRLRTGLRSIGVKGMYFDDHNRRFMSVQRLKILLEQSGFKIIILERTVLFPWAALDPLNRLIETTPLKHLCVFIFIYAQK